MDNVYSIKDSNVNAVAELMAEIKPEWWDFKGAKEQLQNVYATTKLIGWCLGESESKPRGWILCSEAEGYSYLAIECLGFNDNGNCAMEEQLEQLIVRAEDYAREKKYRNLKYVIGSVDMSCHGKPIADYAKELASLKSYGRKHFDYFAKYGFVPTGFIPNCYGKNYHGIIMMKDLT